MYFMAYGENKKVTAAHEGHRVTGLSRMWVSRFYEPNSEAGFFSAWITTWAHKC